jgi:hypothetical protein
VNKAAEVRVKIAIAILIEILGAIITRTMPAISAMGEVPKCSQPLRSGGLFAKLWLDMSLSLVEI